MSNVISQVSTSLADGNKLDDVFDNIAKGAGLATEESNRLKVAFQNFNTEGKNAKQINAGVTSSLQGLTGGLSKAAVKQALMNTAFNALVSIGVGAALTAIAKGYQYLAEYQEKTIEAGREATNSIKESNQVYQDNSKWIKQNGDRYAELARGVERGTNISLTAAEFDEYNQLTQEIATRFPDLVIGYDSLGNAILACGDDVNKLNVALSEQRNNNLAETLGKTAEIVKAFQTESNSSQTFLQSLGFGETTIGQESAVVDALLNSAGTQEDFIKAYSNLNASQRSIASEIFADAGIEAENIEDYYNNIDILIDKNKALQQARAEATEGMQELASAYLQDDVTFKKFSANAQNALINIADSLSFDFFTSQGLESAADFKKWSANATQAIKEGGLQDELDSLFSISPSKLTKNSFASLNEDIQNIASALQIEDIEEFKLQLGIDEETFNASFEAAKENLIAELDEDFANDTAVTNWLNTLTQSELDIVANFELRGTESLDYLQQKVASTLVLTKDLENLSSEVDTALGNYGVVTTALSELNSEGRITTETLETLKGTLGDVEGLYQYTSQGIQVNAQALKEMADTAAETTLAEIEMREALDVIEYQEKTQELNKYCEAHEGLRDALENNSLSEYNDNIDDVNQQLSEFEISTIEALYTSTTALAENINGYDELEMRIHAATSALNDYVRAQETANASDNMQTAAGGLEGAKELYKQGWTTKDDYTSYMDYIGYQEKGSDNYVKYAEELFKRAAKYLTEDASGIHKFINDMISKGISGIEGSDYTNVKFTPQVDLDEVAREMDMTTDFITDMFLAMRDAGYEINFSSLTEGIVDGLNSISPASETARTDLESFRHQIDKLAAAGVDVTELEAIYSEVANAIQANPVNFDPTLASLDELTIKSEEARQSLSEIANNAGVDFEFKADLNGDISAIENQLESLQEFRDTQLTVGTEEWKDANILIAQTVGQLHEAENQVILDIDTSSLNEKTAEVVELLQKFRELQNEKEVQLAVDPDFDSSKIDSELENIRTKLSGLNDEDYNTIKTHLKLDSSSVDNLDKTISQITPEMTGKLTNLQLAEGVGVVQMDADPTKFYAKRDQAINETNATITVMQIDGDIHQLKTEADSGKRYIEGLDPNVDVGANTSQAIRDIHSALNRTFTFTARANVVGMPRADSQATGTAHAEGTVLSMWNDYRASIGAYAYGNDWSLPYDEKALVNEVGTESIVRDGKWFTIPGGAHVEQLKKGDIIFNAQQTEELRKTGRVISGGGHGRVALADGTAHNMINAYSNVSGGATNLVKPTKSSNSVVNTVSKTTKAVEKALKELEEAFDWIAVKFERLARIAQKAEEAIERAQTLNEKLSATSNAISAIHAQKNAAKKAVTEYEKQFKQIAKATGLSKSIQKKVQNGSISMGDYSDKTQEKINKYKEAYDNYLEAIDMIDELSDKERELALQRLDIIEESFDAIKNLKNSAIELNEARLDLIDAKGLSSVSDAVKSIYQESLKHAKSIHSESVKEVNKYKAEIDRLVRDGYLVEGTQEYNEYLATLNDLEAAAIEAEIAVIEFKDALRDVEFERIQNFIDALDRASNKLQNQIDLMEARDEEIPESMYQEQIGLNNDRLEYLSQQLEMKRNDQALEAVDSDRYKELAEEIADIEDEMYDLLIDNEKLKDSIAETRFADVNEDIDNLNKLQSEISDTRSLLDSDKFIDDNGFLTSEGSSNISLMREEISLLNQEIAKCNEALRELDAAYASGLISEKEYKEMTEQYRDTIRDATKDIDSLEDSIEDLYESQREAQKEAAEKRLEEQKEAARKKLEKEYEAARKRLEEENELLKENIQKRREALQRKADYYNYDRTIRNKEKDINILKAQIAAMDGVTDAAAMAEKKRLEAQLKEAQDDLEATKHQHSIDMQLQELDDLEREIDKTYDRNLDALEEHVNQQEEMIDNMLVNVVDKYGGAYSQINDIINKTNLSIGDSFNQLNEYLNSVENAQGSVGGSDSSQSGTSSGGGQSGSNSGTGSSSTNNSSSDTSKYEEQLKQPENTTNRPVAAIILDKSSVSVNEGLSKTVKVKEIKPSDAANQNVKWKSSDTKIATVSSGKITGVKVGSCTVTCTAADGNGASATVTVTVKATTKIDSSGINAGVGTDVKTDVKTDNSKKETSSTAKTIKVGGKIKAGNAKIYASKGASKGSTQYYKDDPIYKVLEIDGSWLKVRHHKASSGTTGWFKKGDVKAYAKGTKFVNKDQFAITQELGPELITLPDGSMLTKVPRGTGVIPHLLTQNLWELANSADKIIANTTGEGLKAMSNIVNNGGNQFAYHYDSLLTVNGNVDKEALPELKEILKQSYQYTSQQLTKDAKKLGIRGIR